MHKQETATVGQGRARNVEMDGAQANALMMIYIIDLLPWEDEAEGKTTGEIQRDLAGLGIRVEDRKLQRTMRMLMKCGNVEWDEGKPRRFKRFHPQRISDCLARPYALPEMDSEIHFDARLVTR